MNRIREGFAMGIWVRDFGSRCWGRDEEEGILAGKSVGKGGKVVWSGGRCGGFCVNGIRKGIG